MSECVSVCMRVCVCREGVLGYSTSAQLQTRLAPSTDRCCSRRNPAEATRRDFHVGRTTIQSLSFSDPPPPPHHRLSPCAALKTAAPVLLAILERINSTIDWLSCTWRGTEGNHWSATACLPPGLRKSKKFGVILCFGFGGIMGR